jgi:glycerophosphoryl diester phosphodiesterase
LRKRTLILVLFAVALGLGVWSYTYRPVVLEQSPLILGHGGMGTRSLLPLNSIESIREALSFPIQGSEIDVRMTSDAVLIAFHDNNLSSVTNCNGIIEQTSYSEIEKCNNSTWFKSSKIEALTDILGKNWPSETTFSLDIKEFSEVGTKRSYLLLRALKELTLRFPNYNFLVESMQLPFLAELRGNGTNTQLFFYARDLESELPEVSALGLDGVSINMELTSKEQIALAQNSNIKVMLWGTGSVFSNRKALQMSPDIIQTDDISSMMKLLEK